MITKRSLINGRFIEIAGSMPRHKIVKTVVNIFIATEYRKKGKGVRFRYPVEKFQDSEFLYIERPGHKKNFDFKVDVPDCFNLGEGTHKEIAKDLRNKNLEKKRKFKELFKAIGDVYHCRENSIDIILQSNPTLTKSFKSGSKVEVLLKVIKWLFIMEDIVYWDNEGRAFLFNFLKYACTETSQRRYKKALNDINDPSRLKSYMRKCDAGWDICEG